MTERWRLTKSARTGPRTARCIETPHPLGRELRVIVSAVSGVPAVSAVSSPGSAPAPGSADDLVRSEVFRERAPADAAAAAWRAAFEGKGWRTPAPGFAPEALRKALGLTRAAQARVPGGNGMGHVLSYRLKVMGEALEVALDEGLALDAALRDARVREAMRELARAERGPEGRAFVRPILEALGR